MSRQGGRWWSRARDRRRADDEVCGVRRLFRRVPEAVWVLIAVSLYLYLFVRVQWRVGDEGDMLNGALAVAEGRIPYRDFYDLRGPASFYWLGLFFKVFGASWYVARMHLLITGVVSSLLVYQLARRVCHVADAILACACVTALSIPAWPAAHHHWDSNLFALSATSAFFRARDRDSTIWLIVSGVLAGLTSCFMYQKGFYLVASFIAVMLIDAGRRRHVASGIAPAALVVGAYATVGLIAVAWFVEIGALRDLIDATITSPLNTYAGANRVPYAYHLTMLAVGGLEWVRRIPAPIVDVYALLLMLPALFIAALPFLLPLFAVVCLVTRGRAALVQPAVVSYGLIGTALWASEFHRRDIMHLVYGCPLLLITFWILIDVIDGRAARRKLSLAVLAVAVGVVMVSQGLKAASAHVTIDTRRGRIVVPKEDAALRFLLSDSFSPGDYVFVYPYYSTYYFLANLRNPTRYGELVYGPGSDADFQQAIAALEAHHVQYILWDTVIDADSMTEWFPAYRPPLEDERLMERYFEQHYRQVALLNGFRVLRRNENRSASVSPSDNEPARFRRTH